VDIRSLKCFRLAYEHGSIGKAAKHAYLSRQGLSQILKSLETEIKQTLFSRTHRGLEPTEMAHLIYPKTVELLNSYDDLHILCFPKGSDKEIVRLSVAFGAFASLPFDKLAEEFHRDNPAVRFNVDSVEPLLAQRCIADGIEDLALIVGCTSGLRTRCYSLCRVPLDIIVHESLLSEVDEGAHPLACLKGLTWFGLSSDSTVDSANSAIMSLSREQGLDINFSFDWHDYHLIIEQVRQRKGVCFLPKFFSPQFCQKGICTVPSGDTELTWELSLVISEERPLSPAAQAVFDWFTERLRNYFSAAPFMED